MFISTRRIVKADIDSFGHVNNAVYLEIFEQARWDALKPNGLDLAKMQQMGIGSVIVDIHLKFLHEVKLHDEVKIHTQGSYHKGKTFQVHQELFKDDVLSAQAEFIMVFFDLNARKAILPNDELLALYNLKP